MALAGEALELSGILISGAKAPLKEGLELVLVPCTGGIWGCALPEGPPVLPARALAPLYCSVQLQGLLIPRKRESGAAATARVATVPWNSLTGLCLDLAVAPGAHQDTGSIYFLIPGVSIPGDGKPRERGCAGEWPGEHMGDKHCFWMGHGMWGVPKSLLMAQSLHALRDFLDGY